MIPWFFESRKPLVVMLIFFASCSGNVMQTTVFQDGFQELETEEVPEGFSGNPAIYFEPARGRLGEWEVASHLRQPGFNQAWEVRREGELNYFAQTFTNLNEQNAPLSLTVHPMVVAGDSLWKDCTIEAEFTPLAKFDKCGVVFKYRNPTDYFFFGIEGNTVTLKQVMQSVTPLRPIEKTLDSRPLVWTPGQKFYATITLRRNKVFTILNDSINMHAEDLPNQSGRIGLLADIPARFHRVVVKQLSGEQRKLARRRRQLARRQQLQLGDHPEMVHWKSFDTEAFGTDQNIRLGDLNGDGNKEILFVRPSSAGEGVACLTATNLQGEVLWQHGDPGTGIDPEGSELPVQIHDLDGNGTREVIYISSGSLYILSGRNGELQHQLEISPEKRIRAMIFGDLLGAGRDNCMILSDRTGLLMVFNDRLELLWEKECSSGAQPLVYDLDGDGKDEVLMGYSVFGPDGVLKFDVGEYIGDVCNGVAIQELHVGERLVPSLAYAAGDWGLIFFDFNGNLLKQNIMGHVKYMSVGDYDADIPGLEVVTSNYWGSDGLIHLVGPDGEIRGDFLPSSGLCRCQPVNWKGDGEEFILTAPDSIRGGLFSATGELAVAFPDDGHPSACYLVQDLTGDARDELIVWDTHRLWIYTQDDNPRMGNTYAPHRAPLYNHSMHQMVMSVPGW
jgi:rhamnogalacturonan endolyase